MKFNIPFYDFRPPLFSTFWFHVTTNFLLGLFLMNHERESDG